MALVLAACGATHLERAKDHHARGLAALRKDETAAARGHFEAAAKEAAESVAAHEEKVPRQGWLVQGGARLRLGDAAGAREALGSAHALGPDPDHEWLEPVLTADACELLRAADVAHAEALCWTRVLDSAEDPDLRIRAATEYANALARRLPHTGALLDYGDATFRRFLALAVSQPLDGETFFLLARRLPLFCDDPAFSANKAGWRELQGDLLRAALSLGWFRAAGTRVEAERYLKELEARPLCGG